MRGDTMVWIHRTLARLTPIERTLISEAWHAAACAIRQRAAGIEGQPQGGPRDSMCADKCFSSVQAGITSIGILNGAIGEGAIAGPVRHALERVPMLHPYAGTLSLLLQRFLGVCDPQSPIVRYGWRRLPSSVTNRHQR
jgi:hypothetical protein